MLVVTSNKLRTNFIGLVRSGLGLDVAHWATNWTMLFCSSKLELTGKEERTKKLRT
jgi:hypothetical protein